MQRRGTALNFTAYVGHSALRLYVMGDAAYERAATADEIERMCELVREGDRARARPASRRASRTRTAASTASRCRAASPSATRSTRCSCAAGEAGKGVVLITPGEQCTYADVYEWQPRVGRPFTYPLFAAPGGKHLEPVAAARGRASRTARSVWPQVTPRPLTMQFTMADAYSLNTGQVFGELMKVSRAVRLAAYRDPEWRALAAADLEQSPMKPRWDTFEVSESAAVPRAAGPAGERPRARARLQPARRDVRDRGGRGSRRRASARTSPTTTSTRWATCSRTSSVALGLSDAGAHIDQLCDAPLPTDLLGTWVRERGVMPLERAVRKLTGEPADMFGFARRGYLREGYWADVCVFDPDDGRHRARRGACATSRPTPNGSPPRSRPACGTCS